MMQLLNNDVIRCAHHKRIFSNSKHDPYFDKSTFVIPFKKACEKAVIPYGRKVQGGCTFHDIRRTVKTNMTTAGMHENYIDLILGHTLPGMSKRYIKPNIDVLQKEMKLYSDWLENEIEKAMCEMGLGNQNGNHELKK